MNHEIVSTVGTELRNVGSCVHGRAGQVRMSRLDALGLALNTVVWWNTLYLDAAVKMMAERGLRVAYRFRCTMAESSSVRHPRGAELQF
ncbi:hypothetical protein P8A22_09315 [Streptomyces laculatispora]|uniref:Tn3 transposase DDE domain-containing protein n=1 Tax=Streptomyces laculatispora TaxID=887464 RepID=A0ABY9I1L3_9ACTN|nr:hypothetical protein [Streptomyces laculatispora]WLQ40184.1 hypothetical protein P8A22_09315 [Streptomyces laculatispora]